MNLFWFLIKNIHKLTFVGTLSRIVIKKLTIIIGTFLILNWGKIRDVKYFNKTNSRA
jgi:hypothetical protein